jgi:hypothetical protein
MRTAERANVFLDVMMAGLTEVCIRIYLSSTMGTNGFTDGLATLSTEHCFGLVDSTTIRAGFACGLLLMLSHLHLHGLQIWPGGTFQDLLRTYCPLCLFVIRMIIYHDDSSNYNSDAKITIIS